MYLRHITSNRSAEFLLFCFPYAGAGPYLYNEWVELMPPFVGLWGVNYWPKGQKIDEEPKERQLELIAKAIAKEMALIIDRPFAIFGHSMGCLVAYEVNRLLQGSKKLQPTTIFFSSSRAPHRELPEMLSNLKLSDFRRRIIELKGIPSEIINSESLLSQMLNRILKDFIVCENYLKERYEPIIAPLKIFAGSDDNLVEFASIEAWGLHAGTAYSLTVLNGNHFYIHSQRNQLVSLIKNELGF